MPMSRDITQSGWGDLNSRPLVPQTSALTKLRYSPLLRMTARIVTRCASFASVAPLNPGAKIQNPPLEPLRTSCANSLEFVKNEEG